MMSMAKLARYGPSRNKKQFEDAFFFEFFLSLWILTFFFSSWILLFPFQFLLSRYGDKEDAGVYFDPATNKCIEYDHLEQKCKVAGDKTGEELKDLQGDEESEKLRSEIYSHLCQTYMKNSYPYGTCAVYSTSSSGNGIAICISSTVYKPRSYWSGRWTSEWVLTDKSSLKGKCAVATHYYENGNVQFRSNREFVVKDLGVKDKSEEASAIAQAVKRCISEEEFGYQEDLEESLRDFSETTFKKLRRQLPLTQLTFPWTTGASSLATELMSREK